MERTEIKKTERNVATGALVGQNKGTGREYFLYNSQYTMAKRKPETGRGGVVGGGGGGGRGGAGGGVVGPECGSIRLSERITTQEQLARNLRGEDNREMRNKALLNQGMGNWLNVAPRLQSRPGHPQT